MLSPTFPWLAIAIALASPTMAASTTNTTNTTDSTTSSGIVYVNPLDQSVLGANYTGWRTNDSFVGYNPTNTNPPFIQAFDQTFYDLTGKDAKIRPIVSNPGWAFAHGASIYVPDFNVVFFASKSGGPLSYSGWDNNSVVSMLNMSEVDAVLSSTSGSVNIQVHSINISDTVQMVEGGTGLYKGKLLFVTSGRGLLPPSIVVVDPSPPYNTTVLLDNFYGRQFNSLKDVKVLPGSDIIYFTDNQYGNVDGFRPPPTIPLHVYRFDPSTGHVRGVADQLVQPNGLAFAADGKTAFVTDTGEASYGGMNQTRPSAIYQYDVNAATKSFENRRLFAYVDAGFPEGIQLDTKGNVYAGCGDGVQVWNSEGTLIGKFFINATASDLAFTKSGLLIFSGEAIHLVDIEAEGADLTTL